MAHDRKQGRQQQAFEALLDPEYLDEDLLQAPRKSRSKKANSQAVDGGEFKACGFRLRTASERAGLPIDQGNEDPDIRKLREVLGAGLDEALIREVYNSPQGGSIEATAQALLAMGFGDECSAAHTQVTGTQHQPAGAGAQLEQQGATEAGASFWELLPLELRHSIWERLNARQLSQAARTCSFFAAYVRERRSTMKSVTLPPNLSSAAVSGMLAAFPAAHKIDASKCMPHVRHELHAKDLFEAIRRGCQLRRHGVPLTSLDLHGCDTLTIVELTILLDTLDTLQELNLSDCQHVTDEAAILLSKYEATGLAAQHSEEANHPQSQNETKPGQVTDASERDMTQQRAMIEGGMARLRASHQPTAAPKPVRKLGLTSLNLAGCQQLSRSGCKALLMKNVTSRSLEVLDLSDNPLVTNQGMDFNPTSRLRVLKAQRCLKLKELVIMLPREQQLTELHLSGCAALREVALTLPNLQFLNLSHCKRLEGLSHSTPRLTKLVLSQCPRLTDWDESSVVSRLKLLNIHSCASLENDVLKTILARCPGLEGLDANGCQHISSLDFTKHLQLRAVDVSGCHLLRSLKCDSPGLTCLRAKNCLRLLEIHLVAHSLQELDLQNCTGLKALPVEAAQAYKLRYCVCGCTALPWHEAAKLKAVAQTGCMH